MKVSPENCSFQIFARCVLSTDTLVFDGPPDRTPTGTVRFVTWPIVLTAELPSLPPCTALRAFASRSLLRFSIFMMILQMFESELSWFKSFEPVLADLCCRGRAKGARGQPCF